ncbi:MAG TPA: polysaccharide deacetylase family protein [Methanocella sp.]|jgi:peptidoglycan/xylan/chitin deacetylase (PgdA/CDA1 family)
MMPDRPNVLLIIDPADAVHLPDQDNSECWGIHRLVIDYRRLHDNVAVINRYVTENHIDFVMYSRNDQVADGTRIGSVNRRLLCGYSSFSGIDDQHRIRQMKECYDDFIRCDSEPVFDMGFERYPGLPDDRPGGSFSLLFDTEQAGCIRHALPQILPLLGKYRVNATFFMTNIMKKMYPSIPGTLRSLGHEVGLHGLWHESLIGMDGESQIARIRTMKADLGPGVHGANFIGRMNEDTVHALVANDLQYFVYPALNKYRAISYPEIPAGIVNVRADGGTIRLVPIAMETYSNPWFSVRSMVDAACDANKSCGRHITILCHPFRDGNLRHSGDFERLLEHLTVTQKMKPALISELEGGTTSIDACSYDSAIARPGIPGILPHAKRDFTDLIPQNYMLLYRLLHRRRTIW